MHILIGSTSDRKIDVVKKVFQQYHDTEITIEGLKAPSGVSDTPYDKETYTGAQNRANYCKENGEADIYVGLESGLVERYGHLYEEAWAVILIEDKEFAGYSSGLKVPDIVTQRMKAQNKEHYEVMMGIEDEMGYTKSETWGMYSGGQISREISLEESVRNAVIQMLPHEKSLFNM